MPTSPPPGPTDAERRIYGDLIDEVLFLRSRGLFVARFKGQFRVGSDVLSAGEVRQRVADMRRGRVEAPKPIARTPAAPPKTRPPVAETASPFAPPAAAAPPPPKIAAAKPAAPDCPCGRPATHQGRCWSRRGLDAAPPPKAPARKVPPGTKARLSALEDAVAAIRETLARMAATR